MRHEPMNDAPLNLRAFLISLALVLLIASTAVIAICFLLLSLLHGGSP